MTTYSEMAYGRVETVESLSGPGPEYDRVLSGKDLRKGQSVRTHGRVSSLKIGTCSLRLGWCIEWLGDWLNLLRLEYAGLFYDVTGKDLLILRPWPDQIPMKDQKWTVVREKHHEDRGHGKMCGEWVDSENCRGLVGLRNPGLGLTRSMGNLCRLVLDMSRSGLTVPGRLAGKSVPLQARQDFLLHSETQRKPEKKRERESRIAPSKIKSGVKAAKRQFCGKSQGELRTTP
ncbi:hypothetical protein F2Q68_00026220 [Brassica cretica]|uniref:DUF4283 domain-containing protein n=1 Tax=Brassica cretica TaxID=69181 RepID=A0A8S9I7D7_BRACR|nr:hypothetical protein F2Q68_00026220 [Brassica cretica]